MALFPGFFRKDWYVPAGLSAAALFYNPELLLHSVKPHYMLAVSADSVGFLALALMLFDFRRLAGAVASMKREAQLALGGFFCIAAGHFFLNGRYPFDALGESLVWILLPLAAYVYYNAFRFFLPRALALLGLWDLVVSVSPQSPPCQKSGEQNFWSCFFAFECVRTDFSSLTGKR